MRKGERGEREEEIMETLVKCSLKVNSAFRLKKSPYFAQRSSAYIVRKISASVRHSGLEDIIENIQCSFNWEWSIVAFSVRAFDTSWINYGVELEEEKQTTAVYFKDQITS